MTDTITATRRRTRFRVGFLAFAFLVAISIVLVLVFSASTRDRVVAWVPSVSFGAAGGNVTGVDATAIAERAATAATEAVKPYLASQTEALGALDRKVDGIGKRIEIHDSEITALQADVKRVGELSIDEGRLRDAVRKVIETLPPVPEIGPTSNAPAGNSPPMSNPPQGGAVQSTVDFNRLSQEVAGLRGDVKAMDDKLDDHIAGHDASADVSPHGDAEEGGEEIPMSQNETNDLPQAANYDSEEARKEELAGNCPQVSEKDKTYMVMPEMALPEYAAILREVCGIDTRLVPSIATIDANIDPSADPADEWTPEDDEKLLSLLNRNARARLSK